MKTCRTCGETKETSEFYRDRTRKDGLFWQCKSCRKAYRESNRPRINAYRVQYYLANKDKEQEYQSQYRRDNKGLVNAITAKRRSRKRQATPYWSDQAAIKAIYVTASEANDAFAALGINQQLHVDHIVPLKSNLVCGLHVAENLQLLPAAENTSKSNSFNIN